MLCERHGSRIKPAVNHFRHTLHGLSAFRAGDGDGIDIRTMQLHRLRFRIAAYFFQFLTASYGKHFPAVTLPDIQGSSPIPVSGQAPVLDIFQPVSETALTDGFRDPVDGIIVGDQMLFYRRHFDKPGFPCIVDQRRIASPAEGITVFKFRRGKQQVCCRQFFQDNRIRILTEGSRPGSFLRHLTLGIH